MNRPAISVIIPVYNVEKYLKKCLDTVLSQTFSDIEIICVNDGSKDNSRKILTEYKEKDCRIKIVDKKNGGLSSARNAGLKIATGEFIVFIDSDDWIEHNMLEKLYNNATSLNTDITICAVHQYNEIDSKIDDSNPYYTLEFFNETFENKVFSYKDIKPFLMDVCVMAWNKIYRKSFLDKCNAQFPDGLIFEDGPFFFSILFKTDRISIIRDFLYYYRINRKGSIVQKAGIKFLQIVDIIELMYNEIKNLPDFEDIKYIFFRKKVEDLMYRFENTSFKYKWAFANKIKQKSSLVNAETFNFKKIPKEFKYHYFLFDSLKNGGYFRFMFRKIKCKLMFKIMEILYFEKDYFYFKFKNFQFKQKKSVDFLDIYYCNDKLYIIIMKKIKFNIPFKYSELEKLMNDD